jgi:hypothetical protein
MKGRSDHITESSIAAFEDCSMPAHKFSSIARFQSVKWKISGSVFVLVSDLGIHSCNLLFANYK